MVDLIGYPLAQRPVKYAPMARVEGNFLRPENLPRCAVPAGINMRAGERALPYRYLAHVVVD